MIIACGASEACDEATRTCANACALAYERGRSIGCEYYATSMDGPEEAIPIPPVCFAAIVANTWTAPAHLALHYQGAALDVAAFARIPSGTGPALQLAPYDPAVGIAPGEVAIVFLSGEGTDEVGLPCPVPSAVPGAALDGTGVADAFRIMTDVPVVAFQIKPYGGGRSAMTGASLLLPTSAWGLEYVVAQAGGPDPQRPSLNIVAREADTVVTITPSAAVEPGPGIVGGPAAQPFTITLGAGQHAQLTQAAELTGSLVTASKPVGFMSGHECLYVPAGVQGCDHIEQMLPPVTALGARHAAVMYRPRLPAEGSTYWRIVGVVDGTQLTYSRDVGGPMTIGRGEAITFETGAPFVVASQDAEHPFLLFTYMSSWSSHDEMAYWGDPDFVTSIPIAQYLRRYVFFADPTYPETNLVVVRRRAPDGAFKDVVLDCAGPLGGWQPLAADLEYTRRDLTTGNFAPVGDCSTGVHEIASDAPFGLWVWGWSSFPTRTGAGSYGIPAGMDIKPLNGVMRGPQR